MRYFKNRAEAGAELADILSDLTADNTVVIAVDEKSVLVGEPIAKRTNSTLFMLVTDEVYVPGESEPIATLTSADTYTYNSSYSAGQIEELNSEYSGVINQKRDESFHKINRIVGKDGAMDKRLLKRHTAIVVSDGLKNGRTMDVVKDFFKPIVLEKLIVVAVLATADAIDKMHITADEIHCLSVVNNFITTDHYYEENVAPTHEEIISIMKNMVFNWK
ncbi:hypothetical protein A3F37_03975 [Candidatus Saccharibacteria bacterium RIFCSPHIGHO2_12_FULL_41_12]|nr:MAG: hypothetical protein A3F37_03975 [Candidatus Saccharibacteria bacterium RIFCSPHIGHO2_12_FULL_41_12]